MKLCVPLRGKGPLCDSPAGPDAAEPNPREVEIIMAQQQRPNESKPPQKGGPSNASQKQDKPNEIIHKSGSQSGPQSGQHSSQDSQQKRDAHSNSAAAGSDDDDADTGGAQHGSTNDERSRGK